MGLEDDDVVERVVGAEGRVEARFILALSLAPRPPAEAGSCPFLALPEDLHAHQCQGHLYCVHLATGTETR